MFCDFSRASLSLDKQQNVFRIWHIQIFRPYSVLDWNENFDKI